MSKAKSFQTVLWTVIFTSVFLLANSEASAGARELQAGYEKQAGEAASPMRGKAFFNKAHRGDWSCATCHGSMPTVTGKHIKTGKEILPLAPKANSERFTDAGKVEKWFRRNCRDVLDRECTAIEKADVISFLRTF